MVTLKHPRQWGKLVDWQVRSTMLKLTCLAIDSTSKTFIGTQCLVGIMCFNVLSIMLLFTCVTMSFGVGGAKLLKKGVHRPFNRFDCQVASTWLFIYFYFLPRIIYYCPVLHNRQLVICCCHMLGVGHQRYGLVEEFCVSPRYSVMKVKLCWQRQKGSTACLTHFESLCFGILLSFSPDQAVALCSYSLFWLSSCNVVFVCCPVLGMNWRWM